MIVGLSVYIGIKNAISVYHAQFQQVIILNPTLCFLMIGPCAQGEFYNPGNGDCVTECPCGTYGDTYRAQCRNGMLLSMLS